MHLLQAVICCLPFCVPATLLAQQSPFIFLEPGQDYVIRFANHANIFKTTKSGFTDTFSTDEDGQKRKGSPASWTMTLEVTIFRVIKVGEGSWVLLEHPKSTDDFAKWMGMRRAKAWLTEENISQLNASGEPGKERLKRMREAEQRNIETMRTWVNLNHAVAISEVPSEMMELKLEVQSIDVKQNP